MNSVKNLNVLNTLVNRSRRVVWNTEFIALCPDEVNDFENTLTTKEGAIFAPLEDFFETEILKDIPTRVISVRLVESSDGAMMPVINSIVLIFNDEALDINKLHNIFGRYPTTVRCTEVMQGEDSYQEALEVRVTLD